MLQNIFCVSLSALSVKPTLRFTPLGATFQRLLGQSVTFHSEIQAPIFPNLTLADITWYGPDGLEITSSMRRRITLNSTTISLTVDNLNRSDDGSYSVRARNSGGMDSQQFSVDVFGKNDTVPLLSCVRCRYWKC